MRMSFWSLYDSTHRESIDDGVPVCRAGMQSHRGEIRVIGRIREMLGLQRQASAEFVGPAALSHALAVEEVSAIKLHARLGGGNLQHAAGLRLIHCGHRPQGAGRFVEYPVVVVTLTKFQLLILCADPRANGGGLAEVKRRPGYRTQLSG